MSLFRKLWQHPGHLIWILVAYLPFLGQMSVPLTGDQKVYLSTALEMRQTGSWLRPILFGQSSYYKPPLQYWATLVGWKIFGFNLWGALLPSVLVVLLTAYLVGEIARLLHERRPFVNAGLWLAACLGTATYGLVAQMEIYLIFFYSLSWWAALRFLADPYGQRKFRWLYLAFISAGFSSLVKSPLYSVFWVVGFLSYLLISGEWELFRKRHFYGAWLAGVAAASVWYLVIFRVDGARFWADYVMRETWDKKSGNGGGPLALWGALLYFCFPFTLLLIPAVRALWRRRARTSHILRFALAWAWPPALFFTFYPYRIKPYLYILVPMLAVVVDWGFVAERRLRLYRAIWVLTGLVFCLVLWGLAVVLFRGELVPAWISAGFVAAGAAAFALSFADRMRGFVLAAIAGVFFFHAACVSLGEQDLQGLRRAALINPGAQFGELDEHHNIWHEVGLLSVGIGKPIARLSDLDQAADLLRQNGFVILTETQYRDDLQVLRTKIRGEGDERELDALPWPRWKVRARFPFRELVRYGRAGVPDFDARTHRNFAIVFLTGGHGGVSLKDLRVKGS